MNHHAGSFWRRVHYWFWNFLWMLQYWAGNSETSTVSASWQIFKATCRRSDNRMKQPINWSSRITFSTFDVRKKFLTRRTKGYSGCPKAARDRERLTDFKLDALQPFPVETNCFQLQHNLKYSLPLMRRWNIFGKRLLRDNPRNSQVISGM